MEKLSNRIADLLLKKHYIEESMYSIYQYGMQMALEIGFSFITSIVICCLWDKVLEGIIFFAVFIPLRSYLGGFHLKSYGACYVCSCVTLVAVLGLSFFEPDYYISWLILCLSIITIFFEARRGHYTYCIAFFFKVVFISLYECFSGGFKVTGKNTSNRRDLK